ncbi:MAG: hypothetical protein ABIS50_25615 [Luteolibacter sp.]|uniref:hypothetical protein n=1 Tax=Luteolibacter sp. TaxID=1962973 RepID=UPI0032636730
MKTHLLLITALAATSLHAQEKPADPYREPKKDAASVEQSAPYVDISICCETFSLPLAVAAKLQRQQLPDSELYKQLLASVEKQTARQESFTVLRGKSGQKSTAESISEQIYPKEYEPAELPNSVGVAMSPPDAKDQQTPVPDPSKLQSSPDLSSFNGLQTPATPTAFETRNVGTTLEIEPTLGEDLKILDLRIVPEIVTEVGRSAYGQGLSTTESPVFESQRINASFTVLINQPFLMGTLNRPPVSKVDPDSANRVWFAFVTATLAKP